MNTQDDSEIRVFCGPHYKNHNYGKIKKKTKLETTVEPCIDHI